MNDPRTSMSPESGHAINYSRQQTGPPRAANASDAVPVDESSRLQKGTLLLAEMVRSGGATSGNYLASSCCRARADCQINRTLSFIYSWRRLI
jgi:hypothetical protein